MKKVSITLLFLTLLIQICNAQPGWFVQPSFTTKNLYDCKQTAIGPLTVASDNGTIFRSGDGGLNWVVYDFHDPTLNGASFKYILGMSNDNWVAVGQQAGYGYYYQGLDSVYRITGVSPPTLEGVSHLQGYFFYAATVAAGTGGSFYIQDASNNYVWRKDTAATNRAAGRNINYSWGIFFVGDNGLIIKADSIGLPNPSGAIRWRIIPSGTNKNLNAIYGGMGSPLYIAVGDDGTIIKSIDYGENWTNVTSPTTEDLYGVWLNYARVICGANGTILRSTDQSAAIWNSYVSPTTQDLYAVFCLGYWDYIAMGANGTILRTTDGGVGVHQTSSEVPEQFKLEQNYPNPFNPKTIINYELKSANHVKLEIYNSAGEEVEVLVNEKQNPGSYAVDFDGSNLTSGVYFYRLTINPDRLDAGVFTEVKKMLLVK